MLKTIDIDNLLAVLMLDLSAAFDTVDHECLLFKLKTFFKITGNALKWFISYLTNRTSAVVINGVYSSYRSPIFGVPQGSILGPLLFILYINELASLEEFGITIHSYADDTTLYIGLNPKLEFYIVVEKLKNYLHKINLWMSKNFLKLDVNKTQLLVCKKKRLLDTYQPHILNLKNTLNIHVDTDLLSKAKLLGVVLDQPLSLNHMITETCTICYFKLTKLRNLRSFLSYDHKIMLLKTFIISRIDYCNSLYACLLHYLLRRLERLLNTCIRSIFNISIFNHNLLSYYFNSHILPIEYRIKYKLCLTVYKILNNLSRKYLTNLVIVYKPLKKNLRSGKDNWIINTRHHSSKAISHQMCLIWNSLPKSLISCKQTYVFKKELKTYFFNEAFRDLN